MSIDWETVLTLVPVFWAFVIFVGYRVKQHLLWRKEERFHARTEELRQEVERAAQNFSPPSTVRSGAFLQSVETVQLRPGMTMHVLHRDRLAYDSERVEEAVRTCRRLSRERLNQWIELNHPGCWLYAVDYDFRTMCYDVMVTDGNVLYRENVPEETLVYERPSLGPIPTFDDESKGLPGPIVRQGRLWRANLKKDEEQPKLPKVVQLPPRRRGIMRSTTKNKDVPP